MKQIDRRLSPRWSTLDDKWDIRFLYQKQEYKCHILDISKEGVRIQIPQEMAGLVRIGDVIDGVAFFCESTKKFDGNFSVSGINSKQNDYSLNLFSSDPQTKVTLWRIIDQVELSPQQKWAQASQQGKYENTKVPGRGIYTEEARLERLAFAREKTNSDLKNLQVTNFDAKKLTSNIENFVGSLEIPVGIAGPLRFFGESVRGEIFAPLATTEGALVASACRGATAISKSGGVFTRVLKQRMMRVPVFIFSNYQGADFFVKWLDGHFDELQEQMRQVSSYAVLHKIEAFTLGRAVHASFIFATGDAAGQNMTTTCTWHACQWAMRQMKDFDEVQIEDFIIEANLSGDKKANFKSYVEGRGTRVIANAFISEDQLKETLKVDSKKLADAFSFFQVGSVQAGMMGININIANIIAAIFAAAGQDIACVHESSIGQFNLQRVEGGVHISLILPSLIVGTVGGGTQLPHQRDYLQMLGCAGPGNSRRFAEIVAGYCLALDVSTLSAIANGTFASAHEKLGRNRPVKWFKTDELTAPFFQKSLQSHNPSQPIKVVNAHSIDKFALGSSIITELTARKVQKFVGHIPFHLDIETNGKTESVNVMVKSKPVDKEVILMINTMANMCGGRLASNFSRFKEDSGFRNCHLKELEISKFTDPKFTDITPKIWAVLIAEEREQFALITELLQNNISHMDTADDTSGWKNDHITAAIKGIAGFHSLHYGQGEQLKTKPWLSDYQSAEKMESMKELWYSLAFHAVQEFPEWYKREHFEFHQHLVEDVQNWWKRIDKMPKTLVHNDFNPRNVCLRKTAKGFDLCAYDWELATIHLPQHDLAEFLMFALDDSASPGLINEYVELHRRCLELHTKKTIDASEWMEGFKLCLKDLYINRVSMYIMAHTFRHYGFMERIFKTLHKFTTHYASQTK
ncbi:MAG: phosphotransferase [Oligoflexales bacterium]